jgi:sodium/potassium-transporting ATPase subunit alpha
LTIYLKGAPERVINRCSTMLVSGDQEVPIDANITEQINAANKRFGSMGERVLAFSRLRLDPATYNKSYPFDCKKWKFWKDETAPGWFPMNNLQLVGLVSLNDPPRPSVDISVAKCRHAGIKVIMVTGD